jgi:hypothetical protein
MWIFLGCKVPLDIFGKIARNNANGEVWGHRYRQRYCNYLDFL